ncbi:transporter substrate-binding domain-containing protein [Bacteroides sp. 519]|uniref:transporter substrate-binding domain-containing protein n=1 Tax=Bacteroides sp. 519 TaxID=2302937 RepID=UPI0013D588B7|nr:transporter substrate-binding domain-containing protein [Bacteroides sp. 519]NDV59696.1 glutamine ABC transporter substrate-binding protein [Bacteroides sp. 519]
MKLTTAKIVKYLAIAVIAVLLSALWPRKDSKVSPIHIRDYNEILSSDTLNVVTEYNSISFYADSDSISGFHYELVKAFARNKGLFLNIVPEMSFEKRLHGLNNGKYDIIAYGIPLTNEWKDSLSLTTPITLSKQILVQRKPEFDSTFTHIQSQINLANKTVYVEKGSPSILRIRNLEAEIADTIYINEIDKYGPEQIMAMVAHADIDYAVVDEHIAQASIDSFPQLDITTGISFTQFYSWGVNKKSPILLDSLNCWLTNFLQEDEYTKLKTKYFKRN